MSAEVVEVGDSRVLTHDQWMPVVAQRRIIVPQGIPLRALIVGGTRGIGAAIVRRLESLGAMVTATGRKELDLIWPDTFDPFLDKLPEGYAFDLVIFAAGELRPGAWNEKSEGDYLESYALHALGPIHLLMHGKDTAFPWWTTVVFISSVGAINAGAVDLGYGMAKAALEKAARALEEHTSWNIVLVRLDAVNTDTLRKLPVDSLHGRRIMEPEEAAELILKEAGVL